MGEVGVDRLACRHCALQHFAMTSYSSDTKPSRCVSSSACRATPSFWRSLRPVNMAKTHPDLSQSSPFPPLRLSDDEKQTILYKVNELLAESLTEYEQFLVRDRATVSEVQWKLVTKRDGLTAYRKRSVSPRASDSSKVHTMLVVGEMEGTIEDVMLGSVHTSPNLTALCERYLYGSSTIGSTILCSITEPTLKSPDRMVRVAWDSIGALSSTVDTVVKPRDFVMAAASGTTFNSSGERIGYLFTHSVDVASAPPVPQAIRAKRHITYLLRQVSPDRMHVYVTGNLDLKGRIPTGVAVRLTSDIIFAIIARVNRFAAMKKRTFLLNQQLQFPRTSVGDLFPFAIPADFFVAAASSGECAVCGKRVSGLLSTGKPCVLCGKSACSSCFNPRHVIVAAGENTKTSRGSIKKLPFCIICDQRAMQLCGWELSVAGVSATSGKCMSGASTNSASTASETT